MYQVIYSKNARQNLKDLGVDLERRIVQKIAFYASQKNIQPFCKPLKELGDGQFRFRVGDYRAIFEIDSSGKIQVLMILRIKHRKDIYDL